MQRRFAEYRPVPRWRATVADFRLFRSVQLNLVGWAAIMALCLSGAVLGYIGSHLLSAPDKPGALAGASIFLGCLVVLDRRRRAQLK
jgi:hypothetical protein